MHIQLIIYRIVYHVLTQLSMLHWGRTPPIRKKNTTLIVLITAYSGTYFI